MRISEMIGSIALEAVISALFLRCVDLTNRNNPVVSFINQQALFAFVAFSLLFQAFYWSILIIIKQPPRNNSRDQ
jgi:hypothetical protein